MTAAAHGIGFDEQLWQIGPQGRKKLIGEAVQEISFTGISLVKLGDDITFSNETFENSAGEAPQFKRLFGEDPACDKTIDGNCYLDSPYTGNIEGFVVMNSVRIEKSSHPTESAFRYVIYSWLYFGQEEGDTHKLRPPDGTCGSAIWDDNGVILGFFLYYITSGRFAGFAATVNASELVKAGYKTGQISLRCTFSTFSSQFD